MLPFCFERMGLGAGGHGWEERAASSVSFLREEEAFEREWHLPGDRIQKGRQRIRGLFPVLPKVTLLLDHRQLFAWDTFLRKSRDREDTRAFRHLSSPSFYLNSFMFFEKPSGLQSLVSFKSKWFWRALNFSQVANLSHSNLDFQ